LVILLNSDTIVTAGWAGKMADAVFSMPGAGLVSPMSNAASLQSIPDIAGAGNQTAINTLPPNLTIDELNACCEAWAREVSRPYVPLVHGFCFGITRKCLEIVGLFDELTFAKGYGEENDYCLRAIERGIWAVVATDTFVYHEKTRSYTEERRTALAASAQRLLYERYGRDAFLAYVGVLEREPSLVAIRSRARQLWDDRLAALSSMDATPRSIGEKSDAAWLDTLTRSVTSEFVDGVRYPRFPNDDLQRRTVGNAGVAAVREAFAFYRHVTEQLSRLQRPLAHDSRVLDFGVGWGRILRCFLREVDPSGLYGVDVSDTFLEAARSTSVPGTFDKIKPDGRLPYPDGYFDVAYAYSVFTHLPAALEHNWLSELSRTLKPGGVLVATVQPPRFIDFIENLSQDQVGRSNWYRELRTQLEAIEGPLETLTRDGFLFLATNNGTTYGDAIMTRKHVEDFWGRWFAIADFIDDESRFRQAVVTLRKIDEPRAIADEVRSDLALSVD
jgi:SAM-dependent methyltransferase